MTTKANLVFSLFGSNNNSTSLWILVFAFFFSVIDCCYYRQLPMNELSFCTTTTSTRTYGHTYGYNLLSVGRSVLVRYGNGCCCWSDPTHLCVCILFNLIMDNKAMGIPLSLSFSRSCPSVGGKMLHTM